MKRFLIAVCAFALTLGAVEHLPLPKTDFAASGVMLKQLAAKAPSELEPGLCVLVGSAYLEGAPQSGIMKDPERAEAYLLSASSRGEVLGDALLSNLYLDQRRLDDYAMAMQRIAMSGQERIAVPAGLLLASFYQEVGQSGDSIRMLRYIAERYGDSRAQFLAGYAISTGEYRAEDATAQDGEFLVYQACTNIKIDPAVQQRCRQIGFKE